VLAGDGPIGYLESTAPVPLLPWPAARRPRPRSARLL